MTIDHLLIIGFGGPPTPSDVKPFLEHVTKGLDIPAARLEAVTRHYAQTGGASPYNAHTQQLVDQIRAALFAAGVTQPLFLGYRNWHPFLTETIAQIRAQGLRHGLGVVLAPHRSYASFGKYVEKVEEAKIQSDARDVRYDYLRSWHDHPLFIEAQANRVRAALEQVDPKERANAHLLFSAHSIPMTMIGRAEYEEQLRVSCAKVAQALKRAVWSIAYQSRSGNPREPWLAPDVLLVLRELRDRAGGPAGQRGGEEVPRDADRAADRGVRQVVVVPIGFLCNHIEVLYDLDLEARQEAQKLEIGFTRASTVMDHPKFVEMFTQLIRQHLGS